MSRFETKLHTHEKIFIRHPNFSLEELHALYNQKLNNEKIISTLFKNDFFIAAISIASPSLYQQVNDYVQEKTKLSSASIQKLAIALLKYFARACTRSTAFGFFAGGSLAINNLQNQHEIQLEKTVDLFETHNLANLKESIYVTNTTLHKLGNNYYFYTREQGAQHNAYHFTFQQLKTNKTILDLLNHGCKGLPHSKWIKVLVAKAKLNKKEASSFFNQLVKEQIIYAISDYAQTIAINKYPTPTKYNNSFQLLPNKNHFTLQANTTNASISQYTINQIEKAIRVLGQLSKPKQEQGFYKRLQLFGTQVYNQYSQEPVPIMELFNPTIGLPYPLVAQAGNYPQALQKLLFNKWLVATKQNKTNIELTASELALLPPAQVYYALYSLVQIKKDQLENVSINLVAASGTTATNLISKYSTYNKEVNELCIALANKEKEIAASNNTTIVELVHLPSVQAQKLALKQPTYTYSLCIAGATMGSQPIFLKDVYVRIDNKKLPNLWHSQLGKIEIRTPHALNPNAQTLPLYNFLYDMQLLNTCPSLGVNWSQILPHANFYPTIQYNNITIQAGKWLFTATEATQIKQWIKKKQLVELKKYFTLRQVPTVFIFAQSDKELVVHTNQLLSLQIWATELVNNKPFTLTEYFFETGKSVVSKNNQTMAHEIMLFHNPVLSTPSANILLPKKFNKTSLVTKNESHVPGGHWIYIKCFVNKDMAQSFLLEQIAPLINILTKDNNILNWFYIYYSSPQFHIRLRIQVRTQAQAAHVQRKVANWSQRLVNEKLLKNIDWCTYKPEFAKFTQAINIAAAHKLFTNQSNQILSFLKQNATANYNQLFVFALALAQEQFIYLKLHKTLLPSKLQLWQELLHLFCNRLSITYAQKLETSIIKKIQPK
jgi:lantibiotic biosynthesis protein